MKTVKRKRSSKAASVAEASGVDVVTADAPVAAEPVEAAIEVSPAAVEAMVVEPVAEVAAESVVDAVASEPAADVSNEVALEQVAEAAAEPALEETVVVEAAVVGDPIVVLAANCSVKDAAALKTSLCAFSNHGDAVTLDVSAVERVDTATMQLLCAFVRDRSGRKQGITWRGESPALQDAVRLLGVGALLGLETKGVAA